ncbi:MAG: hypothetical protein IPL79_13350 [Myxococcales bacterium]|nr:hypothetical protein [Myxococcales bacterium]
MKALLHKAVAVAVLAASSAGVADRRVIESGRVLQDGMAIELGAISHSGLSEYSTTVGGFGPSAQGVVLRDRNGLTTRVFFGVLVTVAGAMAASGPKSVESNTYVSGNYLVTETTTTYYSEAEKQEMAENTSKTVDGLFKAKYTDFELQIFSKDRLGFGDSNGHKATFLIGGGKKIGFEMGLGWGDVNSDFIRDGQRQLIDHKYLGMPVRLSGAAGPLRLALTWEWNWLAHGLDDAEKQPVDNADGSRSWTVAYHPLHFDVQAAFLGQIYVTGGVTMPHVKEAEFGYHVGAGLRF